MIWIQHQPFVAETVVSVAADGDHVMVSAHHPLVQKIAGLKPAIAGPMLARAIRLYLPHPEPPSWEDVDALGRSVFDPAR